MPKYPDIIRTSGYIACLISFYYPITHIGVLILSVSNDVVEIFLNLFPLLCYCGT